MANRVVVREPNVDDAKAIARVHGRAWQVGYADQIPAEKLDRIITALDERTERWRARLAESTDGLLVAWFENDPEWPNELIGICSYGASRDADVPEGFGELHMINLEPTAWGTGAADALFSAAIVGLAERFDGAFLWVLSSNQRAHRFYRRHGWTFDGNTRVQDHGAASGLELVRYSVRFR